MPIINLYFVISYSPYDVKGSFFMIKTDVIYKRIELWRQEVIIRNNDFLGGTEQTLRLTWGCID